MERWGEYVPKHRHLRKLATSWWRLAVVLAVLAATFAAGTAALAGPASRGAAGRGAAGRDAASRRVAIGQKAAIQAALRALGVARRSDAEIVFGLARPIGAHTAVTLGGPAGPAAGGLATNTGAAVTLRPAHAAWLFYDDRGPFQAYEHPGRVALVDTVTGSVTMSGTMLWPPVVGGALPPFLHSADAYAAASGHVFYRPYRGAARLATAARAADGVRAAFDPTQARRAGAVLAAEHACVISLGDTLGGGYYDLARVVQSRGAFAGRVAQLSRAARGVRSVTYAARGRTTPASLARSEVSAHGCREVLLYAAGSGYERGAAINIGMQLGRSAVRHQDVTVAALRSLIRAERRVTFLLVLDAPSAAGFQQLVRLPNVRLVATPAGGLSFTYLPEAIVGGTLQANDRNSAKLLALTYRLAAGLDQVIDDPCEVSQATVLQHAGKSGFAYLLARALARGGTADWVTRTGVGAAPTVRSTGFSAAAPTCLPADAVIAANDAYTAHNDASFGVPGARGLLVNDSDTQHRAITLDQLDGNGGPLPLHGASAKGAAVVVHADGGFSYDARGVAAIQALPRGQTTSDTFSYRITDGLGATDTATVTMTVLGTRNHSPVTQGDTATISSTVPLHGANVLSNDSDPDGDTLAVSELNGVGGTPPLHGTSAQGAAVTLNADGTYTYDPTVSTTLSNLPHATSTPDSFGYGVSDGHGGTATGTVTVTVTGVNHSPVAVADSASTAANTVPSSLPNVLTNDTDVDGDLLTVTQLNGTSALSGTSSDGAAVTIDPHGSFTYDPTGSTTLKALPDGVHMTDSFTYTIDDGHGGTSSATVSITVTGVNDPPVAVNDGSVQTPVATTAADTPLANQSTLFVNDTDPDTGDTRTLNAADTTSTKGAAVTVNSDGKWSYDPSNSLTLRALPRGTSTTDTFTYSIKDLDGAISNTATVTVGVTGTNDPPAANADSASATSTTPIENGPTLFGNDSDPNSGDTLTLNAADTSSTSGAAVTVNADGTWSYDPTTSPALQALTHGSTTTDTFTYSVKDNHGAVSNTATVSVTVTGDHPPVANPDTYSTPAGVTLDDGSNVLTNDTDADGDTLTAILVSGPSNASAFTLNSDGTFSYTPTLGFTGSDTFTYKATDAIADSNTVTVTINVTP